MCYLRAFPGGRNFKNYSNLKHFSENAYDVQKMFYPKPTPSHDY